MWLNGRGLDSARFVRRSLLKRTQLHPGRLRSATAPSNVAPPSPREEARKPRVKVAKKKQSRLRFPPRLSTRKGTAQADTPRVTTYRDYKKRFPHLPVLSHSEFRIVSSLSIPHHRFPPSKKSSTLPTSSPTLTHGAQHTQEHRNTGTHGYRPPVQPKRKEAARPFPSFPFPSLP